MKLPFRFLEVNKDCGLESNAWAYWLIEIKPLFSIVLLKFVGKSRECFHTHAFNAISWILKGKIIEEFADGRPARIHTPSLIPLYTPREPFHKASSDDVTWALSFRGPWTKTWKEKNKDEEYFLTNGRVRVIT